MKTENGAAPMKITDREVERLGKLANIDIDPDSREKLMMEMPEILEFVEKVQKALIGEDADEAGPEPSGTGMREDAPAPCLDRDVVLGEAPDSHKGHFRVPPVIDGDKV
jgi:aspartyl-tRNA(Asn)/glutamyl-tRNA(Gln) amidotransferase subunit C